MTQVNDVVNTVVGIVNLLDRGQGINLADVLPLSGMSRLATYAALNAAAEQGLIVRKSRTHVTSGVPLEMWHKP